jgi:hypothetical protein
VLLWRARVRHAVQARLSSYELAEICIADVRREAPASAADRARSSPARKPSVGTATRGCSRCSTSNQQGLEPFTLPVWLVMNDPGQDPGAYQYIHSVLARRIRGGEYPAGAKLPTEQNWRTNSAAGLTPPRGRCGHSNATGWPGEFSEEGTYRPDRMLIQASHDAPSRLRPHVTSAPPFLSPACPPYTR